MRSPSAFAAGMLLLAGCGAVMPAGECAEVASSRDRGPSRAALTWAPPRLHNPTTVHVTNDNRNLRLDKRRDYILKMPATPLTADGGLVIYGGRNVVLIGGEIRFDAPRDKKQSALSRRGVYVKAGTGTVHIEGLLVTGAHAAEGFNIDMREENAILQLQNIRVETLQGTRAGHHADVIQTWAGPRELRVDRLTGESTYQGMFLHPNQHFKGPAPRLFDFRRVNIRAGAYGLWQASRFPIRTEDVWVDPPARRPWPSHVLWPKVPMSESAWKDVRKGAPPGGDFVPAGVAGIGYVSPGYLPAREPGGRS